METEKIKNISILNKKTLTSKNKPNSIYYLETGHITKNKIEGLKYLELKKDNYPSRAQRIVQDKTIIYSTVRPNLEHYGFIENPIDNLIVSTGFVTIDVVNEDIEPKFLYYFLTQDTITKHLHRIAQNSVSSYPSINPSDIGFLKFKYPKKDIQTQIVNVLSTLDVKIELNRKINKELERMIKTIYNYWFIQFDFPDINGLPYKSTGGKMIYNEKLQREIPIDWKDKELNQLFEISTSSINPYDNPNIIYKYYSIPTFDNTKTFGSEYGKNIKSNKFVVTDENILVSKLNPRFNRVVYPLNEKNMIASTEFVVWNTKNKTIKNYLYMIATHQEFIDYCSQSSSGTSNSHKRVNPDIMLEFKIPYSAYIIEKFDEKINPILQMIANNQKQNQKLTKLRDWLLPMLMNGQVSVK